MKRFSFRAALFCAAFSPFFGVQASNWTDPAFNVHTGDASGEVHVAINTSGEAAVSSVSPDNESTINARKRAAGRIDTWGAESTITTTSAPTRSLIDINNSGDSIAVGLAAPTDKTIYAMYSKGGTTTFTPISIAELTIDTNEIAFAIDPNRQGVNAFGIVLWFESATTTVYARTISVDTGTGATTWGAKVPLSTTASGIQTGPETRAIAFDCSGNAYTVWSETSTGVEVVKYLKYTNGVGFGTPVIISSATGSVDKPVIDVTSSGNVVVIWHNITTNGVEARCLSSGVWSSITQISSTSVDISTDKFRLGVTGAGLAVAVWEEKKPDPIVRAAFLTNLSACTWTSPIFVSSELTGADKLDIDVGISDAGEGTAIIAWDEEEKIGKAKIYPGVFTKFFHRVNGVWIAAEETLLPSSQANEATAVVLAMSPEGDAIIGWKSKNTGSVFANYFPHVFPAIGTSAKQKKDRFLGQTEIYNVLRWGNNPHEAVRYYKVYRNSLGDFVGTFNPGEFLKFVDHNRPNRLESYLIITVQPDGDESFPLRVQVTK